MDSKKARIYALAPESFERSIVTKSDAGYHARQIHEAHLHADNNDEHYYRDLAHRLEGADHLLLMGPGLAKCAFNDHLGNSCSDEYLGPASAACVPRMLPGKSRVDNHSFLRRTDGPSSTSVVICNYSHVEWNATAAWHDDLRARELSCTQADP
jgi:hypothetical protein